MSPHRFTTTVTGLHNNVSAPTSQTGISKTHLLIDFRTNNCHTDEPLHLSTHITCAHKKINMFTVQSIRSPSHDYSSNVPLYFPSHTSVANVFSQEYLSTHAFTSITSSTAHNAHCSSHIRCFQTFTFRLTDKKFHHFPVHFFPMRHRTPHNSLNVTVL